jgi:hypothetical protein
VPLSTLHLAPPEAFDASAIVEAIRGSHRGDVKHPEFVQHTLASGCIGYFVWIRRASRTLPGPARGSR